MLEKIQDFFSDAIMDISNDGWFSYLINPEHRVRTVIFIAIGLFVIITLFRGIHDGSLIQFLGICLAIPLVLSIIFSRRK
jgi:hypothetical protein